MKSIKLTLHYQTGAKLEQIVHYVHFENNQIIFTLKKQVYNSVISEQIKVNLNNLISFDITESEQNFN